MTAQDTRNGRSHGRVIADQWIVHQETAGQGADHTLIATSGLVEHIDCVVDDLLPRRTRYGL